ncbi:MAG: Ankyrin repeats (3 copies) [Verrucomicrobia bacterium ADurb.Bin118]|nr:MAG: Ankyrin repeats (3 copies) [Verrucomicrobia bacterium ADurb.Bin118]
MQKPHSTEARPGTARTLRVQSVCRRVFAGLLLLGLCASVAEAAFIHEAVQRDNTAQLTLLLDKNPELLNTRDQQGRSPLAVACSNGSLNAATLLVLRGADVNLPDQIGITPLWLACSQGNVELVELLTLRGANPNVKGGIFSLTPLFLAVQRTNEPITIALLKAGADPSIKAPSGKTALTYGDGAPPEFKALLQRNWSEELKNACAASEKSGGGQSSIHQLTRQGDIAGMVKLLEDSPELANSAEPGSGDTPLHVAVRNNELKAVQTLLVFGADGRIPNRRTMSALDLARGYGRDSMLDMLILAKAEKETAERAMMPYPEHHPPELPMPVEPKVGPSPLDFITAPENLVGQTITVDMPLRRPSIWTSLKSTFSDFWRDYGEEIKSIGIQLAADYLSYELENFFSENTGQDSSGSSQWSRAPNGSDSDSSRYAVPIVRCDSRGRFSSAVRVGADSFEVHSPRGQVATFAPQGGSVVQYNSRREIVARYAPNTSRPTTIGRSDHFGSGMLHHNANGTPQGWTQPVGSGMVHYNANGTPQGWTQPVGSGMLHHNANGTLQGRTQPFGSGASHFDSSGRLAGTTTPFGTGAVTRDAQGRMVDWSQASGDWILHYDGKGTLVRRTFRRGNSVLNYDGAGRLESRSELLGNSLIYRQLPK